MTVNAFTVNRQDQPTQDSLAKQEDLNHRVMAHILISRRQLRSLLTAAVSEVGSNRSFMLE